MPRGMPAGKQRELEQPALEGAVAEWRAFRDFEMNERCVPQDVIIISTTLAAAYHLRILERFFSDRPPYRKPVTMRRVNITEKSIWPRSRSLPRSSLLPHSQERVRLLEGHHHKYDEEGHDHQRHAYRDAQDHCFPI